MFHLSSFLTYNGMTLEIVVWSLFIGICAGIFGTLVVKKTVGGLVKQLIDGGADSPDNARTMAEVGCRSGLLLLHALRDGSTLRRLVNCTGDPDARHRRAELAGLKWYIAGENRVKAQELYEARGGSVFVALIAVLAFFIAAAVSFTVIPDLVQMASNVFSAFGA